MLENTSVASLSDLKRFLSDDSGKNCNDKSYIMYHCHSDYSLNDSCTKYQEYINLAVDNKMKAISFSEHGKPLNWTEKWGACKEAGIKYIHSVEVYLTEALSVKVLDPKGNGVDEYIDTKVRDNYHTVLMAKNYEGVKEINKLIKLSTDEDHFYYKNRITFDEFLSTSENIISTSACLASPLNHLPEDHPKYMDLAKKYTFLEVQYHNCEEQIEFNKKLLRLSKEIGTPLIAGTDTHSSNLYKQECRSVLIGMKGMSYDNEDDFDLSFKTYNELVDAFAEQNSIPEKEYLKAIENTNLLYDMVEDFDLDVSIKYPILYGTRDEDDRKFAERVERMFAEKIQSGIITPNQVEPFRKAIEEEMAVFRKLEMTGFMLSMSEILTWCKENDIAIGTARGSVGGSRIAYITDIIDLNPETWKTVFSRFANESRKEIGDIDIDCIDSDRPAIFNYIKERFGEEKTARVASFGTMQSKAVIDGIGRYLTNKWLEENPGRDKSESPWSLAKIKDIKSLFSSDEEKARKKYPELFRYYDGLANVKISQSVHAAGMVISPITLEDNFGVFYKDGETCLLLDMENVHDFTGLAKYDFLILKTVTVIRDTCNYIGTKYPKTHEINWEDQAVWDNMITSPEGIFQMESAFAFQNLQKFAPKNIFDMSLVTACIRPSGSSYRDDLLSRKIHKNPSEIIDNMLADNLGYLIYQEDTIKFLQQICGLSGSDSDNIRRAIGRKQKDRLDAAMPSILEGYCSKSSQPREIAEAEAKEFLQVIEDSASYQFGYNHSIAYCLLGYLCAYYRHYYPLEFLTSFLNNAANEEDIKNGTLYAKKIGVRITSPKWGIAKGEYFYDTETMTICKGMGSIKYMNSDISDELYRISHNGEFNTFIDVLKALKDSNINSRQVEILIKIDFFSAFGNQRELLRICELYTDMFNSGEASKISKEKVSNPIIESIVAKYSTGMTKAGKPAKSYTITDMDSILKEVEASILATNLEDLSDVIKIQNFKEYMGYVGYTSDKEEDRRKLYVLEIYPLCRKADGVQFGYSVITKSIGSGIESRFTVFNRVFKKDPIEKNDIIYCTEYKRDGEYFTLTGYTHIY